MPFKNHAQYLRDIRDKIDNIETFIGTMSFQEFAADRKVQAAVERELQIITEAAFRLGDQAEVLCPGLDWRGIRGLGNVLRHAYDHIDISDLWNNVQVDLPPLKLAVQAAVARL